MPGHRFYYPFQKTDQQIKLADLDEFGHLGRALRLKPGDTVEVVNGQGGLARGLIREVTRSFALIDLSDVTFIPRPVARKVTLACAIPKKAKFEAIIEKCTELGVDHIIPLMTERSDVVVDGERAEKKRERFRKVVISAAKQCKRLWFPDVSLPLSFTEAVETLSRPGVKAFIPWLEGERISLSAAMAKSLDAAEFVFFIGPEGDFSPEEVLLAKQQGATPVSLGKNVLKVDTAAMVVVALAKVGINLEK